MDDRDEPTVRQLAEKDLNSGDPEVISQALVGAAFHSPEWQWVQDTCLGYLEHQSLQVRRVAAICLGHVARIHGLLDEPLVNPRLKELLSDPELGPYAEDALEDIRMFVTRKRRKRGKKAKRRARSSS